ncbi:hypothetical protein L2E82_34353 [Cichorium intybus]|uniref:Uncharacterized protein n=1 Tax=Cichorium intybus TaxID=13427 RepID=A0ACB9BLY5_CICIN|nr:hypothetical protein L2E82_34353 [Cichorium intybus]
MLFRFRFLYILMPFPMIDIHLIKYPTFIQIEKADYRCPPWFSSGAKTLLSRILDPNPKTMKLQGDKTGRKGHLAVATEV